MTRRERHERIIASWGSPRSSSYVWGHVMLVMSRHKYLGALTDEVVEEVARELLRSKKHQQKMNEQNRRIRAHA